jgi:hypothetical protein
VEEMEKLRIDLPRDPFERMGVLLAERKRQDQERRAAAAIIREKFQHDLRQQGTIEQRNSCTIRMINVLIISVVVICYIM